MAKFRFVGRRSSIGEGMTVTGEVVPAALLDEFGQQIEFSTEYAAELIRGGCALLPAKDFDALGFTDKELDLYKYPGPQTGAPDEFQTKLRATRSAFSDLRVKGLPVKAAKATVEAAS